MSEQEIIRRAAIALLARREYPKEELFNKLRHKGFNEKVINETIASLEAEGIVNEQRFVENFIDYQRSKGYGPLHIRHRLTA
ncbi:MAG TPA: regulatory protein RecX, partial [Candidatus Angelobacter sp.]|nr:regulatory protein RecX [Candidatus Angelobacter sp.]